MNTRGIDRRVTAEGSETLDGLNISPGSWPGLSQSARVSNGRADGITTIKGIIDCFEIKSRWGIFVGIVGIANN